MLQKNIEHIQIDKEYENEKYLNSVGYKHGNSSKPI